MTGSQPTRALIVKHAVPAALLAALVVPAVALASRLPDPIASHWGLSGAPNGHAPWWLVTAFVSALWCGAWWALASSELGRWIAANIYGLGGTLLAAHTTGLWANLDQPTWQSARHLPGYGIPILVAILIIVASGAIGWVSAGPDRTISPTTPPTVGLAEGEEAVWAGNAHNRWVLAAVPIAALFAAFTSARFPLVVLILLITVILVFSRVTVMVGPTGVTIRLGLLRWPRRHISLERLDGARAISLAPLAYGGWGWRIRPGRTALIVRSGDALELRMRSGHLTIVTVDDAEQAAGLVNDYLSRTHTPT